MILAKYREIYIALFVAVVVFAISVTGAEYLWRSRGFVPYVESDRALWSIHRDIVKNHPKCVALLGSSRILADIDIETMRLSFGNQKIVQLGILGRGPVAVLKDLAEDESFCGLVICEFDIIDFSKDRWPSSESYMNYYHEEYDWANAIDRKLQLGVEQNMASSHPAVTMHRTIEQIIRRRMLPVPPRVNTTELRQAVYDDSHVSKVASARWKQDGADFVTIKCEKMAETLKPDVWLTNLKIVESYVTKIESRGGKIVFVRLPTTGVRRDIERELLPRKLYWDRFAAATSAMTIHFEDFKSLMGFDCVDSSHMQQKDAVPFTKVLCEIVGDGGDGR